MDYLLYRVSCLLYRWTWLTVAPNECVNDDWLCRRKYALEEVFPKDLNRPLNLTVYDELARLQTVTADLTTLSHYTPKHFRGFLL